MSDERVLPTASQEAWEKARKLNELGKILEGWDVLAGEGEGSTSRSWRGRRG